MGSRVAPTTATPDPRWFNTNEGTGRSTVRSQAIVMSAIKQIGQASKQTIKNEQCESNPPKGVPQANAHNTWALDSQGGYLMPIANWEQRYATPPFHTFCAAASTLALLTLAEPWSFIYLAHVLHSIFGMAWRCADCGAVAAPLPRSGKNGVPARCNLCGSQRRSVAPSGAGTTATLGMRRHGGAASAGPSTSAPSAGKMSMVAASAPPGLMHPSPTPPPSDTTMSGHSSGDSPGSSRSGGSEAQRAPEAPSCSWSRVHVTRPARRLAQCAPRRRPWASRRATRRRWRKAGRLATRRPQWVPRRRRRATRPAARRER